MVRKKGFHKQPTERHKGDKSIVRCYKAIDCLGRSAYV